jgi:Arc/MetJ-type ribon-helix-helix transcriptional regulator
LRVKGQRIRVTVEKDLLDWVDAVIATGEFANKSHAVEWGLRLLKQKLDRDLKKSSGGSIE